MESVPLTTADGHSLAADVTLPDGRCHGGVAVCHPHPRYGGDRFNPVVDAVFRRLPDHGFAAIRFDFRAAFGGGIDERADVVAALDELDRRDVGPLSIVGYSFGAVVALATADERITAVVAIAPPLTAMPVDPPTVPVLVLAPRHDQFTPPDAVAVATAAWPHVEVTTVESTDHFLVGRADAVAVTAAQWLAARQ